MGSRQTAPLQIIGPEGVDRIVEGLNITYELDRGYRVAHHGAELLNPELGILQSRTIEEGVIVDEDELRITAFEVSHPPIEPAYGYRLDYGGRSVVISGDSLVTEKIVELSDGADVVLHDAMALQLVQGMEAISRNAGNTRIATVLHDIQDYHATSTDLARLATEAEIGNSLCITLYLPQETPWQMRHSKLGYPRRSHYRRRHGDLLASQFKRDYGGVNIS